MTALGVGVTSNDHVYGWESIKPSRTLGKLELRRLELLKEAKAIWEQVCGDLGESMLAVGNYSAIDELVDQARVLEGEAHRIYNQLNCNHEWNSQSDGCGKCGVDYFDIHTSSIAESTEEWA